MRHAQATGENGGGPDRIRTDDFLLAKWFDSAVLWVHPPNQRARRFYERRGWQTDGTERRQEVLGIEVPEVRPIRTDSPDLVCEEIAAPYHA